MVFKKRRDLWVVTNFILFNVYSGKIVYQKKRLLKDFVFNCLFYIKNLPEWCIVYGYGIGLLYKIRYNMKVLISYYINEIYKIL